MSKTSFFSRRIDETSDHPAIEWISNNKYLILYGIVALFAVIILALRFVTAQSLSAESDFFQAENELSNLQTNSLQGNTAEALNHASQLITILNQYSSLQAKYDGLVAQYLIIDQDVSQAKPLAERAFHRTEKDFVIDFFKDYAKTTLLISTGQYEQAVAEAEQLKNKMHQAKTSLEYSDTLYVFNLIRLAFLYQQLNQPNKEEQAWEDFQHYQGNIEAVLTANQLFREGNLSLNQYIQERKKELNL